MQQVAVGHVEFDHIKTKALRAYRTFHEGLNNFVDPSVVQVLGRVPS